MTATVSTKESTIALQHLRAHATGLSDSLVLFFAQLELLLRRTERGGRVDADDALRLLEIARREFER